MTIRTRTSAAAAFALASALLATGWPGQAQADPDFPSIPQQSSDLSQGAGQRTAPADQAGAVPPAGAGDSASAGLASPQDCTAIKYIVGHVQALVSNQTDVSHGFASKDDGQHAVDADLETFNQIELYLVYAEAGVEDPDQRVKITEYKEALGQVSSIVGERRDQDLAKPAGYDWVGKLAQAQARASSAFLNVGNNCLA